MDQTTTVDDLTGETDDASEMSAADLELEMTESSDAMGPVSKDRADRFYDRVRRSIASYLEKKGKAAGKAGDFLLLVPDIFIPFDLMPEALMGPMGYMDDLVFGVYILNRMVGDTDASILRQHWSGSGDLLETIQKVLNAADGLVGGDFLKKIKKMMG
jgi:uncharacterized membrane protein YkvA (DUF1232 family)